MNRPWPVSETTPGLALRVVRPMRAWIVHSFTAGISRRSAIPSRPSVRFVTLSTPSATVTSAFSPSQSFRLAGESKSSSTLPLTTTPKLWFAESPPGSLAVTVAVAVPGPVAVTVTFAPAVATSATFPLLDSAAYESTSPFGSRKYVDASIVTLSPSSSAWSGMDPTAVGGAGGGGGGGGGGGVGAVDPSPPQESVPASAATRSETA